MPPSCAIWAGFAIGARVALIWQHNANLSYKQRWNWVNDFDRVRSSGWVTGQCIISVFDQVLSINMRIYRGVVSTE